MKQEILLYKKISDDQLLQLKQHFHVHFFDGIDQYNLSHIKEALANVVGLIGASQRISPELLRYAPKLRAISTISVGVDHFDINDLNQRNIRLMHTPHILTDTTADLIMTLLFSTARRVVELDTLIRNKQWERNINEDYYGVDIHHKTIGIIGMGRIGCSVAKRARLGFDMTVLYSNRSQNKNVEQLYDATYSDLDTLLIQSDFVVLTLPLSSVTEKLIDKEKLALMQSNAILINCARGKIIDEEALIKALQEKTIRAAGLDVFEDEPLSIDSPLLSLDNVVLTPHIGSATLGTRHAMATMAVTNLIEAVKDKKPSQNLFNASAVS